MLQDIEYLKTLIDDPEHGKRAQVRADKIEAKLIKDKPRLRSIEDRMNKTAGTAKRIYWLRRAGDVLAEAAKGNTYCDTGCSACCHMPTHLTLDEARLIAKETGAPLAMPGSFTPLPESHFKAVPCTFLEAGRCSIYESRPMSCRVHYVMSDDDALCKIHKDEDIYAPHYNVQSFHMLYIKAHMTPQVKGPEDLHFADIRSFFPKGLNRE